MPVTDIRLWRLQGVCNGGRLEVYKMLDFRLPSPSPPTWPTAHRKGTQKAFCNKHLHALVHSALGLCLWGPLCWRPLGVVLIGRLMILPNLAQGDSLASELTLSLACQDD